MVTNGGCGVQHFDGLELIILLKGCEFVTWSQQWLNDCGAEEKVVKVAAVASPQ
jgi:hypothetical protein